MADATQAIAGRREWIALAILALPCLLVTMDLTVLFLAVPSLTADLAPSGTELLWVTDVYGFLIAGTLVLAGALGDRFGRRRMLLAGGTAFGLASLLAAVAWTPETLIAARALQGVAGAMLLPAIMALVFGMFPEGPQRTKALGVVMGCFALGAALGPLLGGGLIELFDWRAVFVANVPVMVVLLVLAPRLIPESRGASAGRVDVASSVLSVAGVLVAVFAIKHAVGERLDLAAVLLLGLGAALLVTFVRRQLRLADPLVDVRLFARPAFSAAFSATSLGMFVTYGTFFFTAQYLQRVLGLSPLEAGLWGLPPVAAMMITATAVLPRLATRLRPGTLVAGGMAVAAAGLALLTQLDASAGVAVLVPAIVVTMVGLAPATTMGVDLIVGAAPPEQAGSVSGLGQAGNELGGALGIAVLGSIGLAVYRDATAAGDAIAGAVDAAAFSDAVHVVALVAAGIALAGAVLAAVALRDVPGPRPQRAPVGGDELALETA